MGLAARLFQRRVLGSRSRSRATRGTELAAARTLREGLGRGRVGGVAQSRKWSAVPGCTEGGGGCGSAEVPQTRPGQGGLYPGAHSAPSNHATKGSTLEVSPIYQALGPSWNKVPAEGISQPRDPRDGGRRQCWEILGPRPAALLWTAAHHLSLPPPQRQTRLPFHRSPGKGQGKLRHKSNGHLPGRLATQEQNFLLCPLASRGFYQSHPRTGARCPLSAHTHLFPRLQP